MENLKNIVNFIFEIGHLKRVKRSGWWVVGIKDPETVSEHSHRSILIAYILAKLEDKDPYQAMLACAFHDLPEARINDLHKMGQRYINFKEAEIKVLDAQLINLPETIKNEIKQAIDSYNDDKDIYGVIARDADILECIFQAKEYKEIGFSDTVRWIERLQNLLITDSAKKLCELLKVSDIHEWHKNLSKIER